jgi:hypothetical protein
MENVTYKTDDGNFEFPKSDVFEQLKHHKKRLNSLEADTIMKYLSCRYYQVNVVPSEYDYFTIIALELIEKGKGSVICRKCDKTYPAAELKSIKVGHGRTPFEENAHEKSNGLKLRAIFSGNWIRVAVDNIKNPFRKRNSHVPMWGGVGYACPKDHELITLVIHQTLLFFETASSFG